MKALYFPLGAEIRLAVLFKVRSLLRNLLIIVIIWGLAGFSWGLIKDS